MPYQRLMVPIDRSEGDAHALRVALSINRRVRSPIFLLYVVEVPQALELDADLPEEVARGEEAIMRCEQLAQTERAEVDAELLQARTASAAIVDEAANRDIDLIIMSVAGRYHRGEYTLGKTVPYVLKHADCEVWVLRRNNRPL
jgi:nucleotide-binding universal stress UspA family protein